MTFRMSRWQIYVVTVFASICVTPFGFPGVFSLLGSHDWLAALLQAAVTLVGTTGAVLLLNRFSGLPLDEIARESIGAAPARLYLLALGLYFAAWGPVGNQMTVIRMIQSSIYPIGSHYLVVAPMLAAAAFAAWFGPEVIGRVAEALMFVLVPALLVITLIPYFNGDLGRLLPLTPVPAAALTDPEVLSFALGLRGFVLLLLIGTLSARPHRIGAPAFGGVLTAALLVAGLVIAPAAVYGPSAMIRLQFPVMEVMDTVNASGVGIQSFLAITLIVWYALGWSVVSIMLFASAHLFALGTGLGSYRRWMPWVGLSAGLAAAYPYPPLLRQTLLYSWSYLGYAVGFAGPWLLLAAAWLRGRRAPA